MHCISWPFSFWFVRTYRVINAVWEVVWWWTWVEWFSVLGHSIVKFGGVRWRCRFMVTMYWILLWRRRLSPVATRRRLVSADYFGCLLFKYFILCMCFLKENLKRWLVCFSSARLIHQRKIINYLAVWHFGEPARSLLIKIAHLEP